MESSEHAGAGGAGGGWRRHRRRRVVGRRRHRVGRSEPAGRRRRGRPRNRRGDDGPAAARARCLRRHHLRPGRPARIPQSPGVRRSFGPDGKRGRGPSTPTAWSNAAAATRRTGSIESSSRSPPSRTGAWMACWRRCIRPTRTTTCASWPFAQRGAPSKHPRSLRRRRLVYGRLFRGRSASRGAGVVADGVALVIREPTLVRLG